MLSHSTAQQLVFAFRQECCQAEKSTETRLFSILERSMPLLLWTMSSFHDCITKKKLVAIPFHDSSSLINLDRIYLAQIQAHKILLEVKQNNQQPAVKLDTGISLRTFSTRAFTLFDYTLIHLLCKVLSPLGLNFPCPQGGPYCPGRLGRKSCQFVLHSFLKLPVSALKSLGIPNIQLYSDL